MLLSLSQWLLAQNPEWGFLRVFQYLTFRAVMSAMTALLIGLMGFAYARLQHALGTLYASHFENAIFCKAAAVSIFSAGQVIVPVLEGYAREAFLLLYMIPIIWGMRRLLVGAFMLSRRRNLLGEADA